MTTYHRILALVDVGRRGDQVMLRATELAAAHKAALAVAAIVDYVPGFECDHVPFRSPQEMQRAIVRDVAEKLGESVRRLGIGGAEVVVVSGTESQAASDLMRSWRPDLVLVGSHAPHGLQKSAAAGNGHGMSPAYDLLVVRIGRPGLAGRVIRALASAM
jgi:nucleotide-binding universal stress UspA family protein